MESSKMYGRWRCRNGNSREHLSVVGNARHIQKVEKIVESAPKLETAQCVRLDVYPPHAKWSIPGACTRTLAGLRRSTCYVITQARVMFNRLLALFPAKSCPQFLFPLRG